MNYQVPGILVDGQVSARQISYNSLVRGFHLFLFFDRSLVLTKYSIMWAVVLACHAATTNFAGLMVARFFLGCTEASLSPGFTLITSLWYRTSEQPLRHGIWFCGNSLSLIFGNLVAVGILQIEDSLTAWQVSLTTFPTIWSLAVITHIILQWLFIIFGIITFLWGVVMLFRLPDSPTTARFLTEEERLIAIERLRANQTGFKNSTIDKSQIMEAFMDVKTWLLAILILAGNIPNGGFTAVS